MMDTEQGREDGNQKDICTDVRIMFCGLDR